MGVDGVGLGVVVGSWMLSCLVRLVCRIFRWLFSVGLVLVMIFCMMVFCSLLLVRLNFWLIGDFVYVRICFSLFLLKCLFSSVEVVVGMVLEILFLR